MDTNVPIVANGGTESNASPECRLAAIDFLERMMFKGHLYVDSAGEIEAEYGNHLGFGQPGVGNRFIQAFLTSAAQRLHRVDSPKTRGTYDHFPDDKSLRKFDLSDRKFAALSVVTGVPVANATDSDWLECSEALEEAGIKVEFVCGCDTGKWHT